MSDSPAKQKHDEEEEVVEPATKRLKTGEGAEAKVASPEKKGVTPTKEGGSPGKDRKQGKHLVQAAVADEEESEEFDDQEAGGAEDSFDSDFDAPEEEGAHGEDDNFDLEAYTKWRAEHGDEVEAEAKRRQEQELDDSEDEEEGSYSDDDDEEYDPEDDEESDEQH